nr:MAG TPA: hypothetical protein [Caudoviricetes sp.]
MAVRELDSVEGVRVWQIDNDVNGNCRYVVHFLDLVKPNYDDSRPFYMTQPEDFSRACQHIHGKRYRAKWFGGGIVFQAPEGYRARVKAALAKEVLAEGTE